MVSPPTPQANAEQPLNAEDANSIDPSEILKADTDEDETPASKEIAGERIGAEKGKGKQLAIADEPAASGIKSVEEGSMDVPVQQNPDTTVDQTKSQQVQKAKDKKPDWAKTAWARFAAEGSEGNGKKVPADEKPAASGVGEGNTSAPEKSTPKERTVEMLRMMKVRGLPKTSTLRNVTREITEGPLMHVGLDDAPNDTKDALLIFLRADDTRNFLTKNVAIRLNSMGATQSCYGPGVCVDLLGPFLDEELVLEMSGKGAVRRRLTFSRKGLFTKVTPSQFHHDVAGIVGTWNIELVWLFNAGNGTVVFGNILHSMKVLEVFKGRASRSGPYSGVAVSYSPDPCEAALHLVSQMPGGGEVRAWWVLME